MGRAGGRASVRAVVGRAHWRRPPAPRPGPPPNKGISPGNGGEIVYNGGDEHEETKMTKRMALLGAALAATLAGGTLWASDASLAEEGGREYAAGNFAKALEIYDEALKSAAPGNRAPLLFNRANALYRLGRLAEAEETYREAAAADGGLSRDSAFNQGNAAWQAARALQEKEPQKALEGMTRSEALFRRALEQAPGDPDSAYNLDLVRREIHKLRQRLPPPQGQPQQNQNKKQDKKQGDQQDKGQQGEQGQSGQKDKQDGQQNQGKQNQAQGGQDKDQQGQDKPSPNQQGQQGDQNEQKGGQNGQPNEPKDGAQPQKQPNGQGPQGDQDQQANPKGRDGERGGEDGKEPEKSPAGQGGDEPKDGKNGDQDGQGDDQNGQDAQKGDQGERKDGKSAAQRQPGDEAAQGTPRGQDDRAAKTAEQILQREKEDREKRAKARRRQAPVEKDW